MRAFLEVFSIVASFLSCGPPGRQPCKSSLVKSPNSQKKCKSRAELNKKGLEIIQVPFNVAEVSGFRLVISYRP